MHARWILPFMSERAIESSARLGEPAARQIEPPLQKRVHANRRTLGRQRRFVDQLAEAVQRVLRAVELSGLDRKRTFAHEAMHLAELVAMGDRELTLEIERRTRLLQPSQRLQREPAIADRSRRQLDVWPALPLDAIAFVQQLQRASRHARTQHRGAPVVEYCERTVAVLAAQLAILA
jgi:hypothetical protein